MSFLDNVQKTNKPIYDSSRTDTFVLTMSLNELTKYIRYMVADSPNISEKNRRNLRRLLESINIEASYPEENMTGRYIFIFLKMFTEMMLDDYFGDEMSIRDYFMNEVADKGEGGIPSDIVNECLGHIHNQLNYVDYRFSENEIFLLNQYVEDRLQYNYLIKNAQAMKELSERITYGSESLRAINEDAKLLVEKIYRNIRETDTSNQAMTSELDFSDEVTGEEIIQKEIHNLKSPTNKLKVGYKLLNSAVGGGFEGGRTYYFFAPPKSFKSGTLLNLACSLCANNPDVINSVQTHMTPVVVYLTMENTLRETLERLFEYATGNKLRNTNLTSNQVMQIINEKISDKTGIKLVLRYAPSHSETTEFLYDIVEDLKRKGRQPIAMIQDYIGRIKSANREKNELRIVLGEISDQFSVFAQHYGIPLITAGQLNRAGVERKELMMNSNAPDIAQQLTGSYIAESINILNNLDFAFTVCRESHILTKDGSETEVIYNGFHLISQRQESTKEDSSYTYFAQPFENGFKLVEDVEMDRPAGVFSIARALYGDNAVNANFTAAMQPPQMNNFLARPTTLPIGQNGTFTNNSDVFLKKTAAPPMGAMDSIL